MSIIPKTAYQQHTVYYPICITRDETIGLGIMGKPMVRNIMKAGYTDVLVWNRRKAPMDEVAADGAVASNPKDIGESCDVVITMLPNSPQVKEVMLGKNGVASYMKPGAVFIDCSSINPVASREIMQWMHNHEGGQKDHSAIAQYYEFLTGEKIGQ